MNKEIEKIIDNYGGLSTIEPRPGFESGVYSKIQAAEAARLPYPGMLLRPALILAFLILNFATIFSLAGRESNSNSNASGIVAVAEDYDLNYKETFSYIYDGVN